jgi:hypothetical protein
MKQEQSFDIGAWLIVFFVIAMILSAFSKNQSDNSPVYTQEEKRDMEYAKNRFKQEGYSDREADEAAAAVMKFQRAQQR